MNDAPRSRGFRLPRPERLLPLACIAAAIALLASEFMTVFQLTPSGALTSWAPALTSTDGVLGVWALKGGSGTLYAGAHDSTDPAADRDGDGRRAAGRSEG